VRADPLVQSLADALALPVDSPDRSRPFVEGVSSDVLLDAYPRVLRTLIRAHRPARVCDIGAGRNPQLSPTEVEELGVDCTLLDISAEELAQAPPGFDRVVGDIGAPDLRIDEPFDLVFSSMLAEHVADGAQLYRNTRAALRPGGIGFHFFPTLYSLPFVVNRLLPDAVTEPVLRRLKPKRKHKFPAYYSWTRGPTGAQLGRLRRVDLEVVAYVGGFGHRYYRKLPPVERCARPLWRFAEARELFGLTSYAYVVVRRPLEPPS
jgi:SAM-dependent methyltransferase